MKHQNIAVGSPLGPQSRPLISRFRSISRAHKSTQSSFVSLLTCVCQTIFLNTVSYTADLRVVLPRCVRKKKNSVSVFYEVPFDQFRYGEHYFQMALIDYGQPLGAMDDQKLSYSSFDLFKIIKVKGILPDSESLGSSSY